MERWNQFLYEAVARFSNRSFLSDDIAVFLAEYLIYFLFAGIIFYIGAERNWRKRWRFTMETALAIVLARGFLTELIQFFYDHPRPFIAYGFEPPFASAGNSFPSGHTTLLWAAIGTLAFYNRRWAAAYAVFGVLMCLARIFVGVHWPFDILGGIAIGLGSAWLVHKILPQIADPARTLPEGRSGDGA